MPQDFSFDEPNAQRRYRPPDFSAERERDDPFAPPRYRPPQFSQVDPPPRRRLETIEPPEASVPFFSAAAAKEEPIPSDLPPRRHKNARKNAKRRTKAPRKRRYRRPMSAGKLVAVAAGICACAFFVTATVRILLLPTEETVYVFDGSTAQYVLTDDYLPPATMPVVSNVAWDGGDALALLETSKLIGSSDAIFLTQSDTPAASGINATVRVFSTASNSVVEMPLEEYLVGVVAAEVPAGYNVEAIKAQAVAARTYTVRRMASLGGAPDGRGGDICTSAAHCQAYYSTDELKNRWGGNFDKYYAIVRDAVAATQGLILTYDGAPINAFYHANAGGRTANCEDVFVQALPYLRAVDSPGESAYSSYSSTKTLSRAEFAATLSSKTGVSIDPATLEESVRVTSRTDSGRIYRINIAGTDYKGTTFQSWFSLRSTNVTFSMDESNVTMTVLGYGHGVGMSQTGANAMAAAGNSYATILKHYYTGVEIRPYQ